MIRQHGPKAMTITSFLRGERQVKHLENQKANRSKTLTRREFLRSSVAGMAGPCIVPASVFGAEAPSSRITVGMIGMGRQAYHSNLKSFLSFSDVHVAAVCDVDAWRLDNAKKAVERHYARQAKF